MKKILLFTILALLSVLPEGCYKDKGNYDYTNLGEVSLDITSGIRQYQIMLGERLVIPITVTSGTPQSELEFIWEKDVNGRTFTDLFEGKDFDCTIGPANQFPTYGTYYLRLRAVRHVGDRDICAYSPVITLTVSGESGLMVLHGDDSGCDMGVIQEPDFMVDADTWVEIKTVPNLYSESNGAKIPGRGIFTVQEHFMFSTAANCNVYVGTDQTMLYTAAAGFVKQGDYADLFYSLPGYEPVYEGKPQQVQAYSSTKAIIDNGDLFVVAGNQNPKFSIRSEFEGRPDYKLSPYSYLNGTAYLFDMTTRSFLRAIITNNQPQAITTYNSNKGPFNIGDMQADLLYFDNGGASGHFLGVFKTDGGEIFIGEINFAANEDTGPPIAYARYGISDLANFADAKFHAYGSNGSMCYYATSTGVYQYAVLGDSNTTTAHALMMGVDPVLFPGEVTMMKILKPRTTGSSTYQYINRMLIVGTYENGAGTLHAMVLDPISGAALSHKTFTGFGRIYDANLKSM